ncbi:phosphate signaling complex protein PhoU [Paradesertivirga mongoliensis]|uniref:Phosphate-specific transport system accessory protein PhoU n=1 Tax=Paradesertivirga mongoliensis TaxID=2100740 RepID=A0ABW4ZK00_9SPHI|nr:phosphate signaling complex protein PhoU [Pedobacter mongoliensis]
MTHLEEELQKLKAEMTEMAQLVTAQIEKSLTALTEGDKDLASEVIFNEKRVNAYELSIDKECENILALLNPFATDMRFVFATLKINSNFERIGDSAEGIAQYLLMAGECFDKELIKVTRFSVMADTVNLMLQSISKAYESGDTKLARTIFNQDNILDEINKNATEVIASYISQKSANVHQALYLLTIIRKLERVGDHITNIAEEIIFHMEAKILKHIKKIKKSEA